MTNVYFNNRRFEIRLKELGLSKKEAAAAADIQASYLSRITKGEALPSILIAYKIANAVGLDIKSLFVPDSVFKLCTIADLEIL